MAASTEDPGGRSRGEASLEGMEERVRKVRHLDPFHLSEREDGRFTCQLDRPVDELKAEEARAAAKAMESLAARLRARAEEASGG